MVGTEGFEPSTTSTPMLLSSDFKEYHKVSKNLKFLVNRGSYRYHGTQIVSFNINPAHPAWYQNWFQL